VAGSMTERNIYKYKKRPYHHQVAALKKLLKSGWGGALLMEPRTGKTKVVIDYMAILHQFYGVNRVLVVGPVVAIEVWKEQLKENMPYKYRLTIWDRKGRKRNELPRYGQDILDIVLINYDAFSTPGRIRTHRSGPKKGEYVTDSEGNYLRSKSSGGRYDMKKKFKAWEPQLIVLDESHRIKSPSAKKSTALHSLASVPKYRVIMTGTVVTKSKRLFDIYSQWLFLNPERFAPLTFGEFKKRYGRWVQKERYEKWIGARNERHLHTMIHKDAFSITREECYDLPPVTPQIIPVPLEESAELYDRMAEDMVARIHTGEITEASIKLVQTLRLQQITSGLSKTSPTKEHPKGRLIVTGSEKLRMIESRLEDLMEADEKVVIGALFKADILRLVQLGKKLGVPTFAIHGDVKMTDRAPIPRKFAAVSGGAIFIGQPAAAGESIDLSCASILQWYSLPSSWVNFTQFSDRIALSDKPKFHEFYLAAGTVDFLKYETLKEDGDIGKKMIQSPERLLRLGIELED
jgi:SNF2 family DNA or RNA helicase